ncbi:MAG TPA: hypothetical protein VGX21_20720 [Methylomirabilota bacterium]|nr:hypothetical protein [Methylomirabilota bacterium]
MTVTDDEIRILVRARLKTGALPRDLPAFGPTRSTEDRATTMIIRPGRGQSCAACDGPDADVTYRYPDRDVSFHLRCDAIWGEERQLL